MDKSEALWVIIRAVGLIFFVMFIADIASLFSLVSYVVYASDVFGPVAEYGDGKKVALSTAKTIMSKSIANGVLYGLAAFYFMRKGKYIHKVISN